MTEEIPPGEEIATGEAETVAKEASEAAIATAEALEAVAAAPGKWLK